MNQIHDNLPPIELPFFTLFDWVVLGIFGVGVIFLLWNFLRKPRKVAVDKPVIKEEKKFIPPVFSFQAELQSGHIAFIFQPQGFALQAVPCPLPADLR